MRFYNVEMGGRLKLNISASPPSWTAASEGNIFYSNGVMYYGSHCQNQRVQCYGGSITMACGGQYRDLVSVGGSTAKMQITACCSYRNIELWSWNGCPVHSGASAALGIQTCGTTAYGICIRNHGVGNATRSINILQYGLCHAILAWNHGGGNGIQGGGSGAGFAVGGNTAYCNVVSSKYIKHLRSVCLNNCLKETPLNVYKYYYEDANYNGYSQQIGPTAEDFNATFNMAHAEDGDRYEGTWAMDGVALGIGVENSRDIDTLKTIVTKLYACIQKLEA